MSRSRARLLVPLAALVLAWAGFHALSSHDLTVAPSAWPPASAPSPSPPPVVAPVPPSAAALPPSAAAGVPVLPGVMQQLNSNTRETAVGLYALIQQLEQALGSRLEALARQLEPGR